MNKYTEQYFSDLNIVHYYADATKNIGIWNSEKYLIEQYITKDSNILDVGCGTGRVSFGLYEEGYKNVSGIDLSEAMITQAININKSKDYNISFKCENAENLSFKDNSFDMVIFSFNGFCTIPNKDTRYKVMKEINRILKPSGTFIFMADDQRLKSKYKWYWNIELSKWAKAKQDKRIYDFGDLIFLDNNIEVFFHFFGKEELIELLNKCGFKLIKNISLKRFKERKEVLEYCPYGRFWIAQKI
jgi:ubiquinone/menaquinone biosynthesis C-methylase UbiE